MTEEGSASLDPEARLSEVASALHPRGAALADVEGHLGHYAVIEELSPIATLESLSEASVIDRTVEVAVIVVASIKGVLGDY